MPTLEDCPNGLLIQIANDLAAGKKPAPFHSSNIHDKLGVEERKDIAGLACVSLAANLDCGLDI